VPSAVECRAGVSRHRRANPESNGIVERFNGTVRDEADNDYGANYFQAEAIIAKLMHHYNEERLHATLGYMTPATWHRGQPEELREQRAGRIATARAHRKSIDRQRFTQAACAVEVSFLSPSVLSKLT